MPLCPGDKLGRYELLAPIGKGGMGEVWRARDPRLNRDVAIKSSLVGLGRFQKEAEAIAALNHPHICQIYDVGPDYLVMEYIDGVPLKGPLPLETALRIVTQIAGALEAAHSKGILHRDLKPANVLVTQANAQPWVKLLDFGLAKMIVPGEDDITRQTLDGEVLGTAAYMSPEQAQGKPLDQRSDIFSFGAVLYELLSGRRAFTGDSVADVLSAVIRDQPVDIESPLSTVIKTCLVKRASERYQRVAELRAALGKIAPQPAPSLQPSIAVLPFANMSRDPDDEYFSDGLAEEIISLVAQIPGLRVIARTSAFAFKGQNTDVRHIAQTLGVANILEGSVRRSGTRIRVTAQLITATDGSHLWSNRYDREMADVFALQDEIAQAIAAALQGKLVTEVVRPRLYAPGIPAYEAYLKALHWFAKFSPEAVVRSREYLEEAIALDPHFALAHNGLAECFIELASYGIMPAQEAEPLARAAANMALRLEPSLPEAHAVLGFLAAQFDYDWNLAAREFGRARARTPVSPRVRWYYGYFLLCAGRAGEAVEELSLALQDDPANWLFRFSFGIFLHAEGRLADAAAEFNKVLGIDENFLPVLYWLTRNLVSQGMIPEALVIAEKAFSLGSWNAEAIGGLAGLLMHVGDRTRAEHLLEKLGDGEAYAAPIGFANFHLIQGDPDLAAVWLEKAVNQRHFVAPLYLRSPLARLLREGPRWPALAKKMNFPVQA